MSVKFIELRLDVASVVYAAIFVAYFWYFCQNYVCNFDVFLPVTLIFIGSSVRFLISSSIFYAAS